MPRQTRQKTGIVVLILIAALTLLVSGWALFFRKPYVEPFPVVIARLKSPHSGLIHIAEAKGFFEKHGLTAKIVTIQTGYEGIQQVLNGEADFASAAETPIARALAEGKTPQVIATIFTSQQHSGLFYRNDRGISKPSDLKGKRIGFVFGTATHYELETLLAFYEVPLSSLSMIPYKPAELVDAIVAGDVDAASIWTPYLTEMQKRMGGKGGVFSPKAFYSEMTNLVVSTDYVKRRPEETMRVLRALHDAENFVRSNRSEAVAIIARASGVELDDLHEKGDPLTYELILSQSLLLATENEVRWYFKRGMVPGGPFPDVLHAFEPGPLRKIKPSAVTIAY